VDKHLPCVDEANEYDCVDIAIKGLLDGAVHCCLASMSFWAFGHPYQRGFY
jgi:hypothetical protein